MNLPNFEPDFVRRSIHVSLDDLDRLVAGELDETSRQQLLAWCDREPLGWKRCALAFLEAQAWEQSFASSAGNRVAPVEGAPTTAKHETNGHASISRGPEWITRPAPAKTAPTLERREARSWRAGPATLAALMLAAIALGAAIGRFSDGRFGEQPVASPPEELGESHEKDAGRNFPRDPRDESPLKRSSGAPGPLVATVSVGGKEGGAAPGITVQLPVVETGFTSSAADAKSPSVPEYVTQQWARRGWRVEPERKFLPAKLPDGSSVLLPIDRMRMTYNGRGEVY